MKKAFFFVLILLIGSALFSQQNNLTPKKFALVIGNGNYTGQPWGNLRNAVNDAVDIKDALESLGFQVDFIRNGNLSQMQIAVINFKNKLRSASGSTYGFFYFAGHGAQDRNQHNYLIPADADTPSLNLLTQRALPVQFVMDELEEARNELNIIILDACRDIPTSLDRSGSRGLSVIGNIPKGSIVMYSTAANKTASDGGIERNGLFTGYLLKNLTTPGLTVYEILSRTGADVERATNGDQYPEIRQMYHETAYLGSRPMPIPTPQLPVPAPQPIPSVSTNFNLIAFLEETLIEAKRTNQNLNIVTLKRIQNVLRQFIVGEIKLTDTDISHFERLTNLSIENKVNEQIFTELIKNLKGM